MKEDPYFINQFAKTIKTLPNEYPEFVPIHWRAPFLDGCANCLKPCRHVSGQCALDKDDYKNGTFYRCEHFEFPG